MTDKTTIPEHQLLSRLVAGSPNAIALRGYVGPSTSDGHIRLYPSLDDLSESIEIARADVAHAAEVADSNPPGATSIWVKGHAEVTYYRVESVRTPVQGLPQRFTQGGASAATSGDVVEVNRGRLRMLVRGRPHNIICMPLPEDDLNRCQVVVRPPRCYSTCNLPTPVRWERWGEFDRNPSIISGTRGEPGFFGGYGRLRNR